MLRLLAGEEGEESGAGRAGEWEMPGLLTANTHCESVMDVLHFLLASLFYAFSSSFTSCLPL
jgi:hypothetical protein